MPSTTVNNPGSLAAPASSVTPASPADRGATVPLPAAGGWSQVGDTMDFTALGSASWKTESSQTVNGWTLDFVSVSNMQTFGPDGNHLVNDGVDWTGMYASGESAHSVKFKIDRNDEWDEETYEYIVVMELADCYIHGAAGAPNYLYVGISDEDGDPTPEGLYIRMHSDDAVLGILRSTSTLQDPADRSSETFDPLNAWWAFHIERGSVTFYHGTGDPPTDDTGLTSTAAEGTISSGTGFLGHNLYFRWISGNNGSTGYKGVELDVQKIHVHRNG